VAHQIEPLSFKVSGGVDHAGDVAARPVEAGDEPKFDWIAAESIGYFYSVQDRKPKRGEWPFMTSGMLSLPDRILTFTILSHRPSPEGHREAFKAIDAIQVVRQ
jgi:hypothetical protein